MMKTLQVGLGETLRKLSITISKSTQNLWFVSKLQNLINRGSIKVFYEYLTYGKFLTAEQVKKSLDGEASVFMMFASLKESSEKGIGDLPVVQEFPDVLPDDITDLPPEREVEFAIDLVPGTSPISIAPYRMSASELGELKKQLQGKVFCEYLTYVLLNQT